MGRLAPGRQAAAYFLERVGCPLEYFTGRGELAGRWIGAGAAALDLTGELNSPEREEQLRRLLAGRGQDGVELVKPVWRADPRSRVPTASVVRALQAEAARRDRDVEEIFQAAAAAAAQASIGARPGEQDRGEELARLYRRARAELDKARRLPRWPVPTMNVDHAQRLLTAAAQRLSPECGTDAAERTVAGQALRAAQQSVVRGRAAIDEAHEYFGGHLKLNSNTTLNGPSPRFRASCA